jgi:hypothetical protein
MNNRISWSLLRTDFLVVACLSVVAYCLVVGRWPAVVVFALGGAIFCGISPRMTGPFGFSSAGTRFGGSFDDSTKIVVVSSFRPAGPNAPPEEETPPSSTRPSED